MGRARRATPSQSAAGGRDDLDASAAERRGAHRADPRIAGFPSRSEGTAPAGGAAASCYSRPSSRRAEGGWELRRAVTARRSFGFLLATAGAPRAACRPARRRALRTRAARRLGTSPAAGCAERSSLRALEADERGLRGRRGDDRRCQVKAPSARRDEYRRGGSAVAPRPPAPRTPCLPTSPRAGRASTLGDGAGRDQALLFLLLTLLILPAPSAPATTPPGRRRCGRRRGAGPCCSSTSTAAIVLDPPRPPPPGQIRAVADRAGLCAGRRRRADRNRHALRHRLGDRLEQHANTSLLGALGLPDELPVSPSGEGPPARRKEDQAWPRLRRPARRIDDHFVAVERGPLIARSDLAVPIDERGTTARHGLRAGRPDRMGPRHGHRPARLDGEAEREGFEPSKDVAALNGFRDRPVQPLRHLSEVRSGTAATG